MAKCAKCQTTIPDGKEYCEDCELKLNGQGDVSKPDGLLDSMATDISSSIDSDYSIFDDTQDDSFFDELLQQEMQNIAEQFDFEDMQQEDEIAPSAEEEDLIDSGQEPLDQAGLPGGLETEDMSSLEEISSIGDMPSLEDIPSPQDISMDGEDSFEDSIFGDGTFEEETFFDPEILDETNIEQTDEELLEDQGLDHEEEAIDPEALSDDDIFHMSDIPDLEAIQDMGMDGSFEAGDIEGVLASIESGEFERDLMEMLSEESLDGNGDADQSSGKKKKNGKGKKRGFLKTVFGNVVEELTEEEKALKREEAIKEAEREKQRAIDRKNKAKISKAEKKEKKKQEAADKKVAAAAAKAVKAEAAKKKKEEAAERARIKKEEKAAKLAVIELEEDVGRVNRIGSAILVVLFTALAVFIIYGSNQYTYNNKIQSATTNFERQRYNEAYDDVYGLDVKEKDRDIYDKIMTVMFVNKQLNSYNNFYAIGYYAEALDSLLKGLKRYDKYIEFARSIGIESDLSYVREKIVGELSNVFKLDERKALELTAIKEQADYSMEVFKLAGSNKE